LQRDCGGKSCEGRQAAAEDDGGDQFHESDTG
jgi:hypothetical protein